MLNRAHHFFRQTAGLGFFVDNIFKVNSGISAVYRLSVKLTRIAIAHIGCGLIDPRDNFTQFFAIYASLSFYVCGRIKVYAHNYYKRGVRGVSSSVNLSAPQPEHVRLV